MGAALAAADLGHFTRRSLHLGEYPLFGLPAVLVPYPYAWRYQKVNADTLVRHGAASCLKITMSDQTELLPTISDLLGQPDKLAPCAEAMQRLSRPQAALEIGRSIIRTLPGEEIRHGKPVFRLLDVRHLIQHYRRDTRLGKGINGLLQRYPGADIHYPALEIMFLSCGMFCRKTTNAFLLAAYHYPGLLVFFGYQTPQYPTLCTPR